MGARFQVVHQETTLRDADYALDIRADRRGQYFELRVPASVGPSLEVAVLQVQPQERHLVLLVKKPEVKDRFLCGHDEREWFVAALPGTATTVVQAREALKPQFIRLEETRRGLRARERARRRNAVAIRQGEWFFVPMPEMVVSVAHPPQRADPPWRWETAHGAGGLPRRRRDGPRLSASPERSQ